MFFPISHTHVSPIYLVVVGFLIGVLGGFFGVGGSFIAGPALRLVGVDWNFAVGTDLAHIVGKSVVAAKRHRALGNVDLRLGLIMAIGTIAGAEMGAQLIQALKRAGNVNFVVSVVSIVIYLSISTFMLWESWKNARPRKVAERWEQVRAAPPEIRRIRIPACNHGNSALAHPADDFVAGIGGHDLTLDHSAGRLCRRIMQRISWRRCRLHPYALDGLCPRNSNPSCRRHRSFRNHHLRQLRHLYPRHQRQC